MLERHRLHFCFRIGLGKFASEELKLCSCWVFLSVRLAWCHLCDFWSGQDKFFPHRAQAAKRLGLGRRQKAGGIPRMAVCLAADLRRSGIAGQGSPARGARDAGSCKKHGAHCRQ